MNNAVNRLDRSIEDHRSGLAWDAKRNPNTLVGHNFGANPGNLRARKFVPANLPENSPLVVVLHGCMQTPDVYDQGAGWTDLANRYGFAVLFPAQQRWNNINNCFNWFEPGDMHRGGGEPASIKTMIDQMANDHTLDKTRMYITGLSAGAAMAGVMIATYPELFAGGGLIAGLPYGVATSIFAAMRQMRRCGLETDTELAEYVRSASGHGGPWPIISIWHGTEDATVDASNGHATAAQWCAVHGLADAEDGEDLLGGHTHRIWRDSLGRNCVEEYMITGMGHGTPLDACSPGNAETAGAFFIDVGLSSTRRLALSWGLDQEPSPKSLTEFTS